MNYVNQPRPTLIDGIRRPARPSSTPQPPSAAAPHQPQPATTTPENRRWRLPVWAQLLLAVPVLLIGGFAIQSPAAGHLLIFGYGVAAFIWRIPSRTTFSMAVIAMIGTIVLLVTRGHLPLAQIFASYTFSLLVVGVLTLNRELKKEGGRIYSYRPNR